MSALLQLATELHDIPDKLVLAANGMAIKVAQAIVENLSQVTPADTGGAISNWQASIGAPNTAEIGPHAPSPRGRMVHGVWTHTIDPQITMAANAPPTDLAADTVIRDKAPGVPIFITNALPYINKLNDEGTSKQQPAGFVDRALIVGRLIVERTRLDLS